MFEQVVFLDRLRGIRFRGERIVPRRGIVKKNLPHTGAFLGSALRKTESLKADELTEKTKRYLTKDEVNGVMARCDKIVAAFQVLIAEKGEKEVLY